MRNLFRQLPLSSFSHYAVEVAIQRCYLYNVSIRYDYEMTAPVTKPNNITAYQKSNHNASNKFFEETNFYHNVLI